MSKLWHYKDEEGDYRYIGDDGEANIIDDFLSVLDTLVLDDVFYRFFITEHDNRCYDDSEEP